MAVDMFLELDGIKGEAQDKTHKDHIDILAWSFGVSNSGTTHMGSGGGAGRANFGDISVTKYVDKSSPKLMETSILGSHIKKGKLYVRKAGGKQLEYIVYHLNDIIVTSVSTGGSGGEDRLTENIALNFSQMKFEYVPQKPDGTGDTPVTVIYDIAAQESKFDG
ncbi:Hcp family type VI secretion system effector [Algicella marina]|uniref:Type VI secretion system tube protein Hcp n=1 Tax=Algicella marina TaxID=2683284 RepID=A0A6P1T7J8_9RHOB|nr:type VI secretion system tube protein Hcp [Algicella marina]QHQ36552.1 type VI secretion system tube protein Hcp [Algicella marina]